MKNILVIGANSAIAEATIRLWAEEGSGLYLVGRNQDKLSVIVDDAKVRGAKLVESDIWDVTDFSDFPRIFKKADECLDGIDLVFVAHGVLDEQGRSEIDFELAKQTIDVNGLGCLAVLTESAKYFESRRAGCIAVISSVAGDRGKPSNYIYGASKAMVDALMEGIRGRLHGSNVQVLTIKPGFVDTPMTKNFAKNALWASPQLIARDIVKAINGKKDICYTPGYWRLIMLVIRCLPRVVFKRLNM